LYIYYDIVINEYEERYLEQNQTNQPKPVGDDIDPIDTQNITFGQNPSGSY